MLETRTTCAVEAFNGVLGRGLPGNTNFFNFVHYIKKIELVKSIKLRNMFEKYTVTKPKRASITDKADYIRKASEMLETKAINAIEFLNNIACFKNAIIESTKRLTPEQASDSEEEEVTSTQTTLSQPSKRARKETLKICPLCENNEVNVILFPCAHAVVCLNCWTTRVAETCIECHQSVNNHIVFNVQ